MNAAINAVTSFRTTEICGIEYQLVLTVNCKILKHLSSKSDDFLHKNSNLFN